MAEESDGIEEALEGQLRVLVTAASQLGERFARAREEALRRAQARNEQEARELRSRLEAERHAARAELGNVYRPEWWDRASAEQIAHAYQVARAWDSEEPEAVRAEQRMRDELRTRYGVDVDNTQADPAAVRAAVERAQQEQAQADAERSHASADNAEAQRLMTQADQEDQHAAEARAAAEYEPDPNERARAAVEAEQRETVAGQARTDGQARYDSAERRAVTAHELEARGLDAQLVATRMHADVSQATPAAQAARAGQAARRHPVARRTPGRAVQTQRARPGRSV